MGPFVSVILLRMTRTILFFASAAIACSQSAYKKPPEAILKVLNAPATPVANVNPTRTHLLLLEPDRYPPITELAEPMLRLAGLFGRGPTRSGCWIRTVGWTRRSRRSRRSWSRAGCGAWRRPSPPAARDERSATQVRRGSAATARRDQCLTLAAS